MRLDEAQQARIEAQKQVEIKQKAAHEAQQIADSAEQQYRSVERTALEAQEKYDKLVDYIDKDIQKNFEKGGKAKINGHHVKSKIEIRKAYLLGEKIEWNRGGHKYNAQLNASSLVTAYKQSQMQLLQNNQRIEELRSSQSQKQAELKISEDLLKSRSAELEPMAKYSKAAVEFLQQKVKLNVVKSQLEAYQRKGRNIQNEMIALKGGMDLLELQTLQLKSSLPDAQTRLEHHESQLSMLSLEQQKIIEAAQKKFDELQREQQFCQPPLKIAKKSAPDALKIALEACKPSSLTFFDEEDENDRDCSWEEMIKHIVLVHSMKSNAIIGGLYDAGEFEGKPELVDMIFSDPMAKMRYVFKRAITKQGVIGEHLNFDKCELRGELQARTTIHFVWGQLVQGHGDDETNSWEDSDIAILEPFTALERHAEHKVFGVAPYDTMKIGRHRLSERSIVLVPEAVVDEVRQHLFPAYKGQIIPYEIGKKIRDVIIDTLRDQFKDTWHICNENGELIGNTVRHTPAGYESVTYIKKSDGKVVKLLTGERGATRITGDVYCGGLKRYIGLHANAITDKLEKDSYFKALKSFKNSRKIDRSEWLISNINEINIAKMGTLKALQFYQQLLASYKLLGTEDVANYIINEAILADMVCLFLSRSGNDHFPFSDLDIKMILTIIGPHLIELLENVQRCLREETPTKAMQHLERYKVTLLQHLDYIHQAKERAREMMAIEKGKMEEHEETLPFLFAVGEEEWQKVDQLETEEFDLGTSPRSGELCSYVHKILLVLPQEELQLRRIYQQQILPLISPLPVEPKERSRVQVLKNTIQWVFQQKSYMDLANTEIDRSFSILLEKFSKLADADINTPHSDFKFLDYTKNIGDCLFDNVAAQLGDITFSSQLRRDMVDFMSRNPDGYKNVEDYTAGSIQVGAGDLWEYYNNWEEYLNCNLKPRVWSSELNIKALAFMLNRPIALIKLANGAISDIKIYNEESISSENPILLRHVNDNHFVSCAPVEGKTIQELYESFKMTIAIQMSMDN